MIGIREKTDAAVVDAQRYITEMKREALQTIVPSPVDLENRIDLIGLLGGRRPLLRELLLASIEQDGWIALSRGDTPDPHSLDAIKYIEQHAPSLSGKRADQVVEIAKSEAAPVSQSILDVLKRGRNR